MAKYQPLELAAKTTSSEVDPHAIGMFDRELDDLVERAKRMGEQVRSMVAMCGPVFFDQDVSKARDQIQVDLKVDAQKDELLSRTMQLLARYRPVASDLRLVLAVEHIAIDLERSADHAKNIAKRALSLANRDAFDPVLRESMLTLHSAVSSMFSDSLTAFATRNAVMASDVRRRDHLPDSIFDDLFHSVVARIQVKPATAAQDVQALFVGKSLERIGDHATNIGEEVCFLARGDIATSTRTS